MTDKVTLHTLADRIDARCVVQGDWQCHHLSHTPKGKCFGCGEQHQPLSGHTEAELNDLENLFWARERGTTA